MKEKELFLQRRAPCSSLL